MRFGQMLSWAKKIIGMAESAQRSKSGGHHKPHGHSPKRSGGSRGGRRP